MVWIVRRNFTFMKLMKTILNFAIVFAKEYDEKVVETGILDIMKDMFDSDFLSRMSA